MSRSTEKKAVFFDADGTLCDMEKGVPASTKEALKKLRENGHEAWLCTGRSRAFFHVFFFSIILINEI